MKKTALLVLISIFVLTSSLLIYASPISGILGWMISAKQGTTGVKALCMASAPACEAARFSINPEGYVEGKSLGFLSGTSPEFSHAISAATNPEGFITQTALTEIAKDDPEAAGGLSEALTVSEQLKALGVKDGEIKLDEEGEISEASFSIKEEGQIGNIIGKMEKEEVTAKDVKIDKKEGLTTLTIQHEGYVKIKDKLFMNIEEGGTLKLNENGDVTEADLTSSKGGTYELGERKIEVEQGTRIVYKEGILEIYGKEKTVEIDEQKITLNGEYIEIDGQKITGEDFTLDEKNFRGIKGKNAEVTLIDEGYLLGKNTEAENARMIVTSEKGNILVSKTCQDTSGFKNYVNPCKGTLTIEGQVKVQLKEGRNFGLNIEKDDKIEFDSQGGRVIIEEGIAGVSLKPDAGVKITNGEVVTIYKQTAEGIQVTTEPDSIGKQPDIDLTTVTEFEEWSCAIETNEEGISTYYCPVKTSQITTKAIVDVTGSGVLDECKKIVDSKKEAIKEKLQEYKRKLGPGEVEIVTGISISKNTEGVTIKEYDDKKHVIYESVDEKGNLQTYRVYVVGDRGLVWLKTEGEEEPDIYEEGITSYERAERLIKKRFGDFQGYINSEEAEALGLKVKKIEAYVLSEEELKNIKSPSGNVEYQYGGAFYMDNGEVWQVQDDGVTVECVNCETKRVYKGR